MDTDPPSPRTPGEAALFLHQEVAKPITARRAAAVAGGQHATYVIDEQVGENALVQQWLER